MGFVALFFGLIGFYDDYLKVFNSSSGWNFVNNSTNDSDLNGLSDALSNLLPEYDASKWKLISETRNYDLENKFSYSYLSYKV